MSQLAARPASSLRSCMSMFNSWFRRQTPSPPEQIVLRVEMEREDDGRWVVDIVDLPGVMAYGTSEHEAISKAAALALRVIAERLEQGEALPSSHHVGVPLSISLQPA
jgi:predicted RNase H-like HicB family nuclease